MPAYSAADKQVALDFAASVNLHDYRAAVQTLTNVANAGNLDLAADLLGALHTMPGEDGWLTCCGRDPDTIPPGGWMTAGADRVTCTGAVQTA